MGDPSRTRLVPLRPSSVHVARTERLARVGRCCDGGRRRRARSWGDPLRTRSFSFLAFFNPFWPSSVHYLEQSKRRRGTTLRRSSPPTCSGLRASGLGREIIAVSGPHYVRHTFGSGSESLRLGSNCLRRTHIVETEPEAVRIDRADIAPLVRQFASSPVRQLASSPASIVHTARVVSQSPEKRTLFWSASPVPSGRTVRARKPVASIFVRLPVTFYLFLRECARQC